MQGSPFYVCFKFKEKKIATMANTKYFIMYLIISLLVLYEYEKTKLPQWKIQIGRDRIKLCIPNIFYNIIYEY